MLGAPNADSQVEEFVRERGSLPPEVAELKNKVKSITDRMEEAISNHDFAAARAYSDEERKEREKLLALYEQYGLLDWIYG